MKPGVAIQPTTFEPVRDPQPGGPPPMTLLETCRCKWWKQPEQPGAYVVIHECMLVAGHPGDHVASDGATMRLEARAMTEREQFLVNLALDLLRPSGADLIEAGWKPELIVFAPTEIERIPGYKVGLILPIADLDRAAAA